MNFYNVKLMLVVVVMPKTHYYKGTAPLNPVLLLFLGRMIHEFSY